MYVCDTGGDPKPCTTWCFSCLNFLLKVTRTQLVIVYANTSDIWLSNVICVDYNEQVAGHL